MQFIDANVFIRHLTKDNPDKAQACFELLKRAKNNDVSLITTEAVVAEVVYVLSSKTLYDLPRQEIRTLLYPLLSLPGLKLAPRRVYLRALDLYAEYSIDFEDALIASHMEHQGVTELYSYDSDFDQLDDVKRIEP